MVRSSSRRVAIALICLGLVLLAGCGRLDPPAGTPATSATPAELAVDKDSLDGGLVRWTFQVDGADRELIVAAPKATSSVASPTVLVFHGHGGTADKAADSFGVHGHWPDAIAVYMQGLPAPGVNDPEGTRPGWQKDLGQLGDRDIRYVSVALGLLRQEFEIDPGRIYVLGQSNGARFVNVLWASDIGGQLAALCSSAAQGGELLRKVPPRSLFMVMGQADPLSPFDVQVLSVELAREVLGTDAARATANGFVHAEPGKDGLDLVTYIHPGGHEFPAEAMPDIIAFFMRHRLPG